MLYKTPNQVELPAEDWPGPLENSRTFEILHSRSGSKSARHGHPCAKARRLITCSSNVEAQTFQVRVFVVVQARPPLVICCPSLPAEGCRTICLVHLPRALVAVDATWHQYPGHPRLMEHLVVLWQVVHHQAHALLAARNQMASSIPRIPQVLAPLRSWRWKRLHLPAELFWLLLALARLACCH